LKLQMCLARYAVLLYREGGERLDTRNG
jgi:hypothetical protein